MFAVEVSPGIIVLMDALAYLMFTLYPGSCEAN